MYAIPSLNISLDDVSLHSGHNLTYAVKQLYVDFPLMTINFVFLHFFFLPFPPLNRSSIKLP